MTEAANVDVGESRTVGTSAAAPALGAEFVRRLAERYDQT